LEVFAFWITKPLKQEFLSYLADLLGGENLISNKHWEFENATTTLLYLLPLLLFFSLLLLCQSFSNLLSLSLLLKMLPGLNL